MATVTELVTKFSFDGSPDPLSAYNKNLGSSIKLLAGFGAAAVAAGGVIAAWSHAVLQGVDALGDLSADTGIAIARIQELSFAAQLSGSSAESFQGSLRELSSSVGLAANDMGRGKEIFKELGVNVRNSNGQVKNAADVFDELRLRMNELNLSMDERRGFAQRLGLDATLVQLLSRTDSEMSGLIERARELGTLTQEQADAAGAYNDALDVMSYSMTAIKQQIAVGLAPVMQDLAESFTDLLAENKDWIISGIKTTIDFIGNLLSAIKRLLPVLTAVGVGFLAAKIYMMGFGAVAAVVFSPVTLITAAIVALLLIVDDLIVAFKGGDSIIGAFFENFLGIDLSKTIGWLKEIWAYVTKISSALFDLGFKNDSTKFLALSSDITTGQTGSVLGNNTTDNRKIEQTVNIEVKSSDPEMAGRAASDGVQRQLKDANAQLGVGGI